MHILRIRSFTFIYIYKIMIQGKKCIKRMARNHVKQFKRIPR